MDRVNAAALFIVAALWGLHLGYPTYLLQNYRVTFLGYIVPVYFFFFVGLMAAALALALAFKRHWSRWEVLWWALPLICLPGILHSSDPLWSVRQWLSWLVRGVIPGGILFMTASRRRPVSLLLYWIYPIVIAASILGLREVFTHRNPIWDRVGYGSSDGIPETGQPDNPFYRPQGSALSLHPRGTQGNRIPFTATLVGFLPLAIWLLRYRKRFLLVNSLAAVLLFSTLMLSLVRGAQAATLAAVLLMGVLGLMGRRREIAKFIAGLMIIVSVLYLIPTSREFLWGRLSESHFAENNIRYRLEMLETARVLKGRWLSGVGFSQFPTACLPYYRGVIPWKGTADDQYFRWAVENGMPGLLLMLGFFAGLIYSGWKKIGRIENVEQADFYKSLLVGWLSLATTFLFFDGFYWGACNMTFWSLLGLFATCLNSAPPLNKILDAR